MLNFIFMVVAISYLYLLVWSLIAGFRTHNEIVLNPFGMPTTWNWRNYLDVFHLLEVNGKTVYAVDSYGEEWQFFTDGLQIGDEVVLTMSDRGTDDFRDDEVLAVRM